jgi:hypothetical protein
MNLTHILNHGALALARLAEQYRNKPRIAGLFTAVGAEVRAVEDALYQLYTERGIDTGVGTQLDAIGAVLAEPRGAATDAEYRLILKAKIRVNKSSGTAENLIAVFHAALPTTLVTVTTWTIAYVTVEIDATITAAAAVLYRRFLRTARAGGVAGVLVWRECPAAECFRFDTGPGFDLGKWKGAGA